MPEKISRAEGRHLFGGDPEGYDAVRPEYPAWIFEALVSAGALFQGAATLEVGPGTGVVTRRLIDHGASPLTLVEPDARFAGALRDAAARVPTCRVVHASFEDAGLGQDQFDLAVAATSFHWIDPTIGMRKLRTLLKDGGTAALMWNVLQVLGKPDPFHEATQTLLAPLAVSPSGAPGVVPYALDVEARTTEARQGGFKSVEYSESHWAYELDTEQLGKLYESFSQIQRLDDVARARVLDELKRIAATEFNGVVQRNVTSCLYRLS